MEFPASPPPLMAPLAPPAMGPGAMPGMPAPPAMFGGVALGAPKKAAYWDKNRIGKIVAAASKELLLEAGKARKWRDEFAAGGDDDIKDVSKVPAQGSAENKAHGNYTYAFVSVLASVLYDTSPQLDISPRESSGAPSQGLMALLQAGMISGDLMAAREAYANALKAVLDYSYECGFAGRKTGIALQEALLCGQGWAKVVFNSDTGLDDQETLRREEVYADPVGRFDITQCRYVAHLLSMPVRDAQEFIAAKLDAATALHVQNGGALDADNQPPAENDFYLQPGFQVADLKGNAQSGQSLGEKSAAGDKPEENDELKLFEVWVKDHDERWVYYTDEKQQFFFRLPWPFVLPHGCFPFENLDFASKGERIGDAFTELQIVDGLKKTYRLMTQYMRKSTVRLMNKKLLIDAGALKPDTVDKLTEAGEEVGVVPIDFKGVDPDKILKLINFNEGDPVLLEMTKFIKQEFDEILGMDELVRGGDVDEAGGGKMTAAEAKIRAANAHTRLSKKRGRFDDWQERVLRLRACIARQLVGVPTVEQIAGKQAGLLWSVEASEPNEFKAEYDLGIEAGSSGIAHRQQKQQTLQQLGQEATGLNATLMQTGQAPLFDIRAIGEAYARAVDENADRFFLPVAPPQAQVPPMGMPGPGGPPQGQPQQMPAAAQQINTHPHPQPLSPQQGRVGPVPPPQYMGGHN